MKQKIQVQVRINQIFEKNSDNREVLNFFSSMEDSSTQIFASSQGKRYSLLKTNLKSDLDIQDNKSSLLEGLNQFEFDKVYGAHVQTQKFFKQISSPLVKDIFQGINGTLFIMESDEQIFMGDYLCNNGLIFKLFEDILIRREIEEQLDGEDLKKTINISVFEIFNDQILDLTQNKQKLIFDSTENYSKIMDFSSQPIDNLASFKTFLTQCFENIQDQHFSHKLVNIDLHSKNKITRLSVVKLAKFQSQQSTINEKIKTDFNTLFCYLAQLSKEDQDDSKLFKDSKLTQCLRQSLIDKFKCQLLCVINGVAKENFDEEYNKLDYSNKLYCAIQGKPYKINLKSCEKPPIYHTTPKKKTQESPSKQSLNCSQQSLKSSSALTEEENIQIRIKSLYKDLLKYQQEYQSSKDFYLRQNFLEQLAKQRLFIFNAYKSSNEKQLKTEELLDDLNQQISLQLKNNQKQLIEQNLIDESEFKMINKLNEYDLKQQLENQEQDLDFLVDEYSSTKQNIYLNNCLDNNEIQKQIDQVKHALQQKMSGSNKVRSRKSSTQYSNNKNIHQIDQDKFRLINQKNHDLILEMESEKIKMEKLAKEIQNKNDIIEQLKEKVKRMDQLKENDYTTINAQELKLQQLKQNEEIASEEVVRLRKKLEDNKQKIQKQSHEINLEKELLNNKINELNAKNNELIQKQNLHDIQLKQQENLKNKSEEEVLLLEQQIKSKNNEIQMMQENVVKLSQKNQNLEDLAKDYQNIIQDKQFQVQSLKERAKEQDDQNSILQVKYARLKSQQSNELDAIENSKKLVIEKYKLKIKSQKADIKDLNSKVYELNDILTQIQTQFEKISIEKNDLLKDQSIQLEQINQLKSQMSNLQAKQCDLEFVNKQQQNQLQNNQEIIDEQSAKTELVQRQLKQLQQKLSNNQNINQKLDDSNKQLMSDLSQKQDENQQLVEKLVSIQTAQEFRENATIKELNEQKIQISKLYEDFRNCQRENINLNQIIQDSKRQLKFSEDASNNFKEKYLKQKFNNKEIQDQHEKVEQNLKQTIEKLQLEITQTKLDKQTNEKSKKLQVLDQVQNMIRLHRQNSNSDLNK